MVFEVLVQPTLNSNSLPTLRKMAGVNISQLIISTCQFPKLSDQSESAFYLSLFLVG